MAFRLVSSAIFIRTESLPAFPAVARSSDTEDARGIRPDIFETEGEFSLDFEFIEERAARERKKERKEKKKIRRGTSGVTRTGYCKL